MYYKRKLVNAQLEFHKQYHFGYDTGNKKQKTLFELFNFVNI